MTDLTIAMIQDEQHWHDPEANRAHFAHLLAGVEQADLVVLPEMFSTGFTMASVELAEPMDGPTMTWLQAQSEANKFAICGSLIIEERGDYFNRFVLVAPGQSPQIYDKRHLFRMAGEQHHYQAGTDRQVFNIGSVRICPQVCYDLRFPVFARNKNDYDLLLCVANWPAARRHHWRTLLTARAIENQCYALGVNRVGTDGNDIVYCGDSGLVSPEGEWLIDGKGETMIATGHIDLEKLNLYRASFPAWRDADTFTLS